MTLKNFWRKRKASFLKGLLGISEFISELLRSEDDAFVDKVRDELEKSGLHDLISSGVDPGKEERNIHECVKKERLELQKVSAEECTEVVKNTTSSLDTSAEHCLLVFLHRVLSDDQNTGPAQEKIIELLRKSGIDQDLIEKIKEKPQNDNFKEEELKKQLEEALAAKTAAESKLGELQNELGGNSQVSKASSSNEAFAAPSPPPLPENGNVLIPPPPPLMPGIPGAVAPPGMPTAGTEMLPPGLKPKKKWRTNGSLRRANWKKIAPQNITEKAFWSKVQEESLAKSHILSELDEKFSTQPKKRTSKVDERRWSTGTMRKVKDIKVLDSKAAQNLSILLGGSFKQMNHEQVKKALLQCDENIFTEPIVGQLIQYLPPSEKLLELQNFKDSYKDLIGAEQFCLKLSEVERLLPRLKAMLFRHKYREMEQDSKPNIMAVTAACEEVKNSPKFSKILELILLLGNYMNSGSRNEQAFGFEMSFLPKLKNTKDVENQSSLLNFLVETVEKDFPDLINFNEELPHIDEASKVSKEFIGNTLKLISTNLVALEAELKHSETPQNEDDKFLEVMKVFCEDAKAQSDIMQSMFQTLDVLHEDLAVYYVYDKKSYTLQDFFTDLATFKDSFLDVRKEYEQKRKLEERREKLKSQKKPDDKKGTKSSISKPETDDIEGFLDVLQQTGKFGKEKKIKPHRHSDGARRSEFSRSRSRTMNLNHK